MIFASSMAQTLFGEIIKTYSVQLYMKLISHIQSCREISILNRWDQPCNYSFHLHNQTDGFQRVYVYTFRSTDVKKHCKFCNLQLLLQNPKNVTASLMDQETVLPSDRGPQMLGFSASAGKGSPDPHQTSHVTWTSMLYMIRSLVMYEKHTGHIFSCIFLLR